MNYKKPKHVCDMPLLNSTIKEQRNPAAYALVASIKGSIKSLDFRKSSQHGKLIEDPAATYVMIPSFHQGFTLP